MATAHKSDSVAPIPEIPAEIARLLTNVDAVATAEEFEALAGALGIDDTDVISPWRVIKDKDELINRPFYIRDWKFSDSKKFIGSFVVIYGVTYDTGEMFIITDGSTGIHNKIVDVMEKRALNPKTEGVTGFLKIANGLRRSDYWIDAFGKITDDESARVSTGSTYYLS